MKYKRHTDLLEEEISYRLHEQLLSSNERIYRNVKNFIIFFFVNKNWRVAVTLYKYIFFKNSYYCLYWFLFFKNSKFKKLICPKIFLSIIIFSPTFETRSNIEYRTNNR